MNRIAVRDTIFWALWGVNALAVVLAVAATGYTQALSEGYLTALGISESFFIFALIFSSKVRSRIAIYLDRRRTPKAAQLTGLILTGFAAYLLNNWVLLLCVVVAVVTKPITDKIHDQLRIQSLPRRAMRDGCVHPDELR